MELDGQTLTAFCLGLLLGLVVLAAMIPVIRKKSRAVYRNQIEDYEQTIVDLRQERADDRETNRRLRRELAISTPSHFAETRRELEGANEAVVRLTEELRHSQAELSVRDRSLREARLAIQEIRVQLEGDSAEPNGELQTSDADLFGSDGAAADVADTDLFGSDGAADVVAEADVFGSDGAAADVADTDLFGSDGAADVVADGEEAELDDTVDLAVDAGIDGAVADLVGTDGSAAGIGADGADVDEDRSDSAEVETEANVDDDAELDGEGPNTGDEEADDQDDDQDDDLDPSTLLVGDGPLGDGSTA